MIQLFPCFEGTYPITQRYGERPWVYGQWGLAGHNGTDYGTPNGVELLAPIAGQVTNFYNPGGYGWNVEIVGTDYYAILAHGADQGWLADDGAYVHIGDPVLVSNNSGFSSGPHLHLGVRPNDPALWTGPMKGWLDPLPLMVTEADTITEQVQLLYHQKQTTEAEWQLIFQGYHDHTTGEIDDVEFRQVVRRSELNILVLRGELAEAEADEIRRQEGL